MISTKQAILETLAQLGQATINEIEQHVGVKATTVRHHLNGLQADRLVKADSVRRPVGRPVMIYFLTEQAHAQLPHQYHRLVARLLDQLKESHSPGMVITLINGLAESLVKELRRKTDGLPSEERRKMLIDMLQDEGFIARWQQSGDRVQLIEYHCPYYLVGQQHPEVCQIDEALIRAAVGSDVEKEGCLLSGDSVCTFTVME